MLKSEEVLSTYPQISVIIHNVFHRFITTNQHEKNTDLVEENRRKNSPYPQYYYIYY